MAPARHRAMLIPSMGPTDHATAAPTRSHRAPLWLLIPTLLGVAYAGSYTILSATGSYTEIRVCYLSHEEIEQHWTPYGFAFAYKSPSTLRRWVPVILRRAYAPCHWLDERYIHRPYTTDGR